MIPRIDCSIFGVAWPGVCLLSFPPWVKGGFIYVRIIGTYVYVGIGMLQEKWQYR